VIDNQTLKTMLLCLRVPKTIEFMH